MNKAKLKKFKLTEKDAELKSKHSSDKIGDIEWEGEEVVAESTTKIQEDQGTGHQVVLRFFDFGANPEVFKQHKPTAQELFDSHRRGIESLLWRDGLRPFDAVEPRLMFSKDKSHYRFIIPCIPKMDMGSSQTLSQLLIPTK